MLANGARFLLFSRRLLTQRAHVMFVLFKFLLVHRSQRNVPFQDIVGALGETAEEMGVSVCNDSLASFDVLVSVQQTHDMPFNAFGPRTTKED